MNGIISKMRITWYFVTLALIIDQVYPYPQPTWIENSANRNRFGRNRNAGSSITSAGNGLNGSNRVADGARRDVNERISDGVESSRESGSFVNDRASSITDIRSDGRGRTEETASYSSQNENGSGSDIDSSRRSQNAVRLPLTAASTRTIRNGISRRERVRNDYSSSNRRINNNRRIGSMESRESETSRFTAVNENRSRKNNDGEGLQSSRREGAMLTRISADRGDRRTLVVSAFNSRNERIGRPREIIGREEELNQREVLQDNLDSGDKLNERNSIRNLSDESDGGVNPSEMRRMRFGERSSNKYNTGIGIQSGEQENSSRGVESRKVGGSRIEEDLTAADGRESQRSENDDRLSFNLNYSGRGRFISRLRNDRTRSNTQDSRIGDVSVNAREGERIKDGRPRDLTVNSYDATGGRLDARGRAEGERGERQRGSFSRLGNSYESESRLTKDDRARPAAEESYPSADERKGDVAAEGNRRATFRGAENRRLNEKSTTLEKVPINVDANSKLSNSGRGRYEAAQDRRDGNRRKIDSLDTNRDEVNRAISNDENTKTYSGGNESTGLPDRIDSAVDKAENRQSENARSEKIRPSENSQGFRGGQNRNGGRSEDNGSSSRISDGEIYSYAVHSPSFELRSHTQEILLSDEEHYTYPTYHFEYAVNNPQTGDIKNQWENRDGDVVKGVYSLHEPDGTIRTVEYISDNGSGFKAVVKKDGRSLGPLNESSRWAIA